MDAPAPPTPAPALPGYTVRRHIGGGAMGDVFEAVDATLGRIVAIKRLRADLAAGTEWRDRFTREARLLAKIQHPNVACVYSVLEHDGSMHIVMELAEGPSLRELLARGPLDPSRAVALAEQIAAGLLAIHEAGVIHRDIKPDNIRLSREDTVKVLDFGLARLSDLAHPSPGASEAATRVRTVAGMFVGTPGYAPPEQVLGDPVTHRADVFSLGCVLFEMLTGRTPFAREGSRVRASDVIDVQARLDLLPHGLDPALRELVRAMLARQEEFRPAGMREILTTLRTIKPTSLPTAGASSTAKSIVHNLPREPSSFIGRTRETADVLALVYSSRLVTLTGLGGVGKSRLALHVARQIAADTAAAVAPPRTPRSTTFEAVCWVQADHAREESQLAAALLRSLGADPGKATAEAVTARIGQTRALIVLDGCEHACAECATLADTLLESCPNLTILAAGREKLGLECEQVYAVPTMTRHGVAESRSGSRAGSHAPHGPNEPPTDAAALFMDRARRAFPGFDPTPDEVQRIEEICRSLDGLPLAIELAAAYADTLAIDDLHGYLQRGSMLLDGPATSGQGSSHARTISSVLEWSYQRLSPPEQAMLRALSVFRGRFSLQAAESVCAAPGLSVPHALADLVRRSLLVRVDPGRPASSAPGVPHRPSPARSFYILLDLVREFASRAHVDPAEQAEACDRHAAHYLAVARAAAPDLQSERQLEASATIDAEYPNLLAALEHAASTPARARDALETAAALTPYWHRAWLQHDGIPAIERALAAAPDAPAPLVARAQRAVGILRWSLQDFGQARAWYERSIESARAAGDPEQEAAGLTNLGLLLTHISEVGPARTAYERACAIQTKLGRPMPLALTELNLAVLEVNEGSLDAAQARFERCSLVFRDAGELTLCNLVRANLAEVTFRRGDDREAMCQFREALARAVQIRNVVTIAEAPDVLALIAWHTGRPNESAELLALARQLRLQLNQPRPPFKRVKYLELERALGDRANPGRYTWACPGSPGETRLVAEIERVLDQLGVPRPTPGAS